MFTTSHTYTQMCQNLILTDDAYTANRGLFSCFCHFVIVYCLYIVKFTVNAFTCAIKYVMCVLTVNSQFHNKVVLEPFVLHTIKQVM